MRTLWQRARRTLLAAQVVGTAVIMTAVPATADVADQRRGFDRGPVTRTKPAPTVDGPYSITRPARDLRSGQPRALSTMGAPPVGNGTPERDALVGPAAVPLPVFKRSFTYAGTSYQYTMLGTDPTKSAATTQLDNTIVPIALTAGGRLFATSATVLNSITSSAIYRDATLPGGTGQYGDTFMRTQFWSELNNGTKNWHVTLKPAVVKAQTALTVPADKGTWAMSNGIPTAFVDVDWLDSMTKSMVTQTDPDTLTQLLTTNVILCSNYNPQLSVNSNSCGIGGFHSAYFDANGAHTYTYQSYLHGAIYGASSGFYGIGPMTHELAEWLSDPFVDNAVPLWKSPLAPQYGCVNLIESADPVVGKFYLQNGHPYADNAYLSWFARQSPSSAWQGRYTWLKSFSTYSSAVGC